jgi:hypothetical protein
VTSDQERWADTYSILKQRGEEGAQVWIAERIGALVLAGDVVGIERFKAIAHRLDQLIGNYILDSRNAIG